MVFGAYRGSCFVTTILTDISVTVGKQEIYFLTYARENLQIVYNVWKLTPFVQVIQFGEIVIGEFF